MHTHNQVLARQDEKDLKIVNSCTLNVLSPKKLTWCVWLLTIWKPKSLAHDCEVMHSGLKGVSYSYTTG